MKPLNSSVFKNIIQCTWHCHAFLLDDFPLHLEPTSTLSYEGCFLLCCLILSHPHIHLIIQAPWTRSFNLRKGPVRPRLPWHSLCVQGLVGFLIFLLLPAEITEMYSNAFFVWSCTEARAPQCYVHILHTELWPCPIHLLLYLSSLFPQFVSFLKISSCIYLNNPFLSTDLGNFAIN